MKSLEDLLTPLVSVTERGQLRWAAPEGGEGAFWADLEDHQILVRRDLDPNSHATVLRAELRNKSETTIDEVSANEYQPGFAVLDHLFAAARRSANGVDAAVSRVEKQLEALGASQAA